MERLTFEEVMPSGESHYSMVLGIAKRARQIVDEADEDGEILDEKPVSIAVRELKQGKYKLIETPNIGSTIE